MAKRRLSKAVADAIKELGRRGGKTRAARLTPERRSEIARKAVQARWAKAKKKRPDDR